MSDGAIVIRVRDSQAQDMSGLRRAKARRRKSGDKYSIMLAAADNYKAAQQH